MPVRSEKEMFWEVHLQMNAYDKNSGIGWRVLNQIEDYLQEIIYKTYHDIKVFYTTILIKESFIMQ